MLDKDMCLAIRKHVEGNLVNPGTHIPEHRIAEQVDVSEDEFILDAIRHLITEPYKKLEVRVIRYGVGGHFAMHKDSGPNNPRRVSGVVLLSESHEYDGGLLQLQGRSDTPLKNIGDFVKFPSATLHGVRPVTRGERWVLVFWLS